MLEKLTYINHLNEVLECGQASIYVSTHELRNYKWTVKKENDRIISIDRGVASRKLPIVIVGRTVEESIAARNRMYEIMDRDTAAQQYGKFIIGESYLKGYVTESNKREWLTSPRHLRVDLTVTTDLPAWVRETRHILRKLTEAGAGEKNLDYAFDYAFDYKPDTGNETIRNNSLGASNFRMIFYGPCYDPEVEIGGHLYRVIGEVKPREYLTIDSAAKTIYLTQADGTRVSKFNDRYRRSYVFEPIPSGNLPVYWGGSYGIDVITFDERSEPTWT